MGSQPWKAATLERWENEFSGQIVVVRNPGRVYARDDSVLKVDAIEGKFLGYGEWAGRPCIYIHQRPDMHVRDEGFWDHEVAVILERGMTVDRAASRRGHSDD